MSSDDPPPLFELYEGTPRLGPGSVATTRRALDLLPDSLRGELEIYAATGKEIQRYHDHGTDYGYVCRILQAGP